MPLAAEIRGFWPDGPPRQFYDCGVVRAHFRTRVSPAQRVTANCTCAAVARVVMTAYMKPRAAKQVGLGPYVHVAQMMRDEHTL